MAAGASRGGWACRCSFGDSLIGMLTLDKLDADFYTAEHAHMAGAFAAYAATAIERARLFNEIESLLEEAKDARRRLVDAIENSSEGFVFFDADDRLVLCNTRYRELLYPGARSSASSPAWRSRRSFEWPPRAAMSPTRKAESTLGSRNAWRSTAIPGSRGFSSAATVAGF